MTVSKIGQVTLPKWWREAAAFGDGGVVEVRPMRDGKNSILLTPKAAKRKGAVGLAKIFAKCPHPIEIDERTVLT
jgi:bifunctional DNA-binding transcriptional regulator/antitoxin component of YhaV-PrlF toxin-antitoxin module